MRPALLVIVMDFLVSSLLLFIGEQNDYAFVVGQTESLSGTIVSPEESILSYLPIASEFSQAVIEKMEDEWRKEYQAQIKEDIFFAQKNMLAAAQERNKALTQENIQLYETLSRQRTDLSQRSEELKSLSRELEGLRRSYQAVQSDLIKAKESEQSANKERVALLTEKSRLEKELARATNELAIKEKEYKEMNASFEKMKERMLVQAQTIDSQMKTIHLQEETISKALKDVLQQQKDYSAEIVKQYADLMHALQSVESKVNAQKSSQAIYDEFKIFSEQQKNLQEAVNDLAETLKKDGGKPGSMEDSTLLQAMAYILEENKQIKNMLQDISKKGALDTNAIAELRRTQLNLQSSIYDIAGKLDQFEAKQMGPFSKLQASRIILHVNIKLSRRKFDDSTVPTHREFSNKCLLPVVAFDGTNKYAISHINDIGLNLNFEIYESLRASLQMFPLQKTNETFIPLSPIRIPKNSSYLAFIQMPAYGSMNDVVGLNLAKDLNAIEKRGYRDVFVVKKKGSGLSFPVEVSPDANKKGYVSIKRSTRQWLHFLNKHLIANPESIPETGDFLVSAEGTLLGLLIDDNAAQLITRDTLTDDFIPIDITSSEAFLKSAESFLRHDK